MRANKVQGGSSNRRERRGGLRSQSMEHGSIGKAAQRERRQRPVEQRKPGSSECAPLRKDGYQYHVGDAVYQGYQTQSSELQDAFRQASPPDRE